MVSLKLGFGSTSLMEPIMSYENVTEYFMHPDYSRPAKRHDIALIRLPERIKTTSKSRRRVFVYCLLNHLTFRIFFKFILLQITLK